MGLAENRIGKGRGSIVEFKYSSFQTKVRPSCADEMACLAKCDRITLVGIDLAE